MTTQSQNQNPHPHEYGFAAMFILAILLMFILNACSRKLYPMPPPDTVTLKDSTDTKVEDIITFIPDTLTTYLPNQKAERETRDTTSHLETNYAISDASIVNGILHHSLETKPDSPIIVPFTREDKTHKETTSNIIEKPVPYPVPYPVEKEVPAQLTPWQNFRMCLGTIAIFATLLVLAAWAVKKFILKL